jgi:hypothetical protein
MRGRAYDALFSVAQVAKDLQKVAAKNPFGFSWRLDLGHAKTGIMVGEHTAKDLHLVIDEDAIKDEKHLKAMVKAWVTKVLPEIVKDPALHMGAWKGVHPKTGRPAWFYDVSRQWPKEMEKKAIAMGKFNNQQAVWHVDRKEEIQTGGTG